jgi:hypothetical protein
MSLISLPEFRLIVANSASYNNIIYPNEKPKENNQQYYSIRISLVKTLKTYVKKYYNSSDQYNVLYLSIAYLDIILSKNRISLSHDKNLKYLCLCCFLLSLKFIGNYNNSKRIISNFCKNYKQEYKIFEIQCLMLLEHNLSYTSVYDFLNMITTKENKKFLALCNYYLYNICEDKIYTMYPSFYISIAIFQLAKNNTNNIKRNHYDKYFKDERVKLLVKKINDLINPSIINDIIGNDSDNFDFNNNYDNISNQSINIFNNNNIHNSIVIINTFSKNKIEKNEEDINSDLFLEDKNNSQRKIIKMLTNNFERKNIEKDKINFSAKSSNFLSRSQRTNKLINYNINFNLLNRISNNKKNSNYEISSYKKSNKNESSKDFLYFLNSYKKNKNDTTQIKRNLINNYDKTQDLSFNNISSYIKNKEKDNSKERRKRNIYNNKSSLNFQLVSGVSREKLLKLSRNLSKTIINACGENNE